MIGIIDYGMGNLKSIRKALEFLGIPVKLIDNPEELSQITGIILPGVGAFPQAMENLRRLGFDTEIKNATDRGIPLLGICLGMQLLFEKGFENSAVDGLGLLHGKVNKIDTDQKIPHMGWNRLIYPDRATHPLFDGLSSEPYMYFVHSYALSEMNDDVIAYTRYGTIIPAAVAKDRIMGVQFHPEKSGEEGLRILRNFGEMV